MGARSSSSTFEPVVGRLSRPVFRREERPESRRNFLDDHLQADALGLESGIQLVVVTRLGSQHTIHEGPPALAKPLRVWVAHRANG